MPANNLRHGDTGTRFHSIWVDMRGRCSSPRKTMYPRYGGRGISVCDRWGKYEDFKEDMYESYLTHAKEHGERQTSIDRIDVNGNYEPGNCRWANREIQGNNTTKTRLVTIDGITQSVSQWMKENGLQSSGVYKRLARGWKIEDALTLPSHKGKKHDT